MRRARWVVLPRGNDQVGIVDSSRGVGETSGSFKGRYCAEHIVGGEEDVVDCYH